MTAQVNRLSCVCCTSLAKATWISNTGKQNTVSHRPFTQGLHNRKGILSFSFPFQMHFSPAVMGWGEYRSAG